MAKKLPTAVVEKRELGRPNKYARARDRLRMARLLYAGKKPSEIAAILNMSTADTKAILTEIDLEWREESKELVKAARNIVLEELLDLLAEYREAWEKSKEARKTSSTKLSDGSTGKKREISNRTEERLGNPAYLQGVERVLKQLSELMGLNAPVKVAPTNPDGTEQYKPYSLEDFGHIINAARQYEESVKDGRSTTAN